MVLKECPFPEFPESPLATNQRADMYVKITLVHATPLPRSTQYRVTLIHYKQMVNYLSNIQNGTADIINVKC